MPATSVAYLLKLSLRLVLDRWLSDSRIDVPLVKSREKVVTMKEKIIKGKRESERLFDSGKVSQLSFTCLKAEAELVNNLSPYSHSVVCLQLLLQFRHKTNFSNLDGDAIFKFQYVPC